MTETDERTTTRGRELQEVVVCSLDCYIEDNNNDAGNTSLISPRGHLFYH